jgi:adenylylsulfate kinase
LERKRDANCNQRAGFAGETDPWTNSEIAEEAEYLGHGQKTGGEGRHAVWINPTDLTKKNRKKQPALRIDRRALPFTDTLGRPDSPKRRHNRMAEIKATNITWHEGHATREERSGLLKQKGATLWFTGLSGSGKSTIAFTLEHALVQRGHLAYVLDGDNIRHGLNKNLGFSAADREENIRRIGEVAKLFADCGVITMTSFISPYRKDRDTVRQLHGAGNLPFIEVFLNTPISTCEQRDPKGLYKKARAGELKNFTGIDDPYEEPLKPELTIDATSTSPQEATVQLLNYLAKQGLIRE